ncbi:hypothetical protein MTX78_10850 [Hymenobacter tibetensis]|jgi:hypothetical protein|uniref:STAS/SEC14 domain-containing protein n=1 Tax=Hymenobacter tibetensis TaxID=497967 RepID=A0ABY4D3H4_9BACT|nr:hypothetical protein [Hymenobacter tibetensis]UOG77080.1 hypothetical protein MTX78_10850 [Hymenobacter tibetensis]
MQNFSTPDYITITYRDDLRMLVARWLRPTLSVETREGYTYILKAGIYFNCPYWLLDGRRRLPADDATTQWGLFEFFPQLSAQIGQRVCMSQLLSPSYQLVTDNIPTFQELENSPQTYLMRRFDDEASAVEWLQECQQHTLQSV